MLKPEQELILKGFIQEVESASKGTHARKFCFVLGAGASKSSGIKTGQELVNIWDKELHNRNPKVHQAWREKLNITEENKANFYSQYYDQRFGRNYEDGYNELEKLMENAKPKLGYVVLASLMAKMSHQVVITTNFDHLLENAINYYTQTIPLVIGHEVLAPYAARPITRPTIIKLHRDLLLEPKNQNKQIETLSKKWEPALSNIFSNYCPIFLGYAGNDKSLMNFLLTHSKKFKDGTWCCPYWLLYKDDKLIPDGDVEQFLEKANGYYIRHNGFDEVMLRLGRALFDYKLPAEEAFLQEAKERYREMSSTFNELTSQLQRESSSPEAAASSPETVETLQAVQEAADQAELSRLHTEATISFLKKEYESAFEKLQHLVELEPDNALYHHSLGATLQEMERYEEALTEKRKAVELEPDNARYHHFLGVTLHKMERYEEALTEKRKAVELMPDIARYHDSLGVTLHEMERCEEALTEKRKAVELGPNNARYHDSLGLTYEIMNHLEDARNAYQKAVNLEPGNEEYRDDLTRILNLLGQNN